MAKKQIPFDPNYEKIHRAREEFITKARRKNQRSNAWEE